MPAGNVSTRGTLVVGEDTFSSLTQIDSNRIAYYRISDQMLCIKNVVTQQITEVLQGFVPQETPVLSTGSKMQVYNGQIYYLDIHKDKCLYSLDPKTNQLNKLTANKVSDFTIINDCLYYNSVTFLVNNDLYKINLKTGGEPENISTNDCKDIVMDGDTIFYIEQNAAAQATAIHEIKNGIDTMIYSKGVKNLVCYKHNLYFIDGDTLYSMPTTGYVKDTPTMLQEKHVDRFIIHDDVIYYREQHTIDKFLSKINIDSSGYEQLIAKQDPVTMLVHNNTIYYYSDTNSEANAGFYKVPLGSKQFTKLSPRKVDNVSYYGNDMVMFDNYIYFVNYAYGGTIYDSHLYKLSLSNNQIEKVQ